MLIEISFFLLFIIYRTVHLFSQEFIQNNLMMIGKKQSSMEIKFVFFLIVDLLMNHLHKIFLIPQLENYPMINRISYRLIVSISHSFVSRKKRHLFSSVDSEIDCNNCMADVSDLFCDKHTFLPCIEPEVWFTLEYFIYLGFSLDILDTYSIQTGANIKSWWTCE